MPERYGKWKSAHDRLSRWRKDGTIDRILARLHARLNDRGLIDTDLRCVGATNIRASRSAAGGKQVAGEPDEHALGVSRGGLGTKLTMVTDGNGDKRLWYTFRLLLAPCEKGMMSVQHCRSPAFSPSLWWIPITRLSLGGASTSGTSARTSTTSAGGRTGSTD